MNQRYIRGTVYWVELPLISKSHVQGGVRPCVIVSNHEDTSGVITVCPLSTKLDEFGTHPRVHVKKDGQVLVEQITTIDVTKIGDYCGTINKHDMNIVDETIKAYLLGTYNEHDSGTITIENRLYNIEQEIRKMSQILSITNNGVLE